MTDNLISRQAAIDALNEKCVMPVWCKVLVKTMLKDLPSAQPETKCVAMIKFSKDDLAELVNEKVVEIENTLERKKGKWKTAYLDHEAMGERPKVLYCSECNQCIAYPTHYCPNCGADMRQEGERDETD